MSKTLLIIIILFLSLMGINAQNKDKYWLTGTLLTPHRMPLPKGDIQFIDLDNDGDPDVMRYSILDNVPVQWIDDDDDMKPTDIEGDMDSDCLMIDRNKDGKYGAAYDLMIDWNDENGDNKADIQAVVDNSSLSDRGRWRSHYMWLIDVDNDNIFNYIDWNTLKLEAWEHNGQSKFFTDYHGNGVFLKAHTNTFNIADLRYNWENPFLFYDEDNDGQTEMAIRYVDEPAVLNNKGVLPDNGIVNEEDRSIIYSGKITTVQIGIDMDNDSRASNELDYDFSIKFDGEGFDYSDQIHKFKSLRGLPEADKYFYDVRWRKLNELIYTDHKNAYSLPFKRGNWQSCWIVYDEDDDCHRWERVEFYDPKDPFKIGSKNGGLDHNPQADVTGDRGEWDNDFSGKGNLYIGKFDGRIHLYGAEWGAWRIDHNSYYYQGWQGWRGPNIQPEDLVNKEPEIVPTIKYTDTDNNGFFDKIEEDLDGDKRFESTIIFSDLDISDVNETIDISEFTYSNYHKLQIKVAEDIWANSQKALEVYKNFNLNKSWYSQYQSPKSIREKYFYGYWLSFYIHKDLKQLALNADNIKLAETIDKAYYGGNWGIIPVPVSR